MRVFVTRRSPPELLQPMVDAGFTVDLYDRDFRCPRDELLARSAGADALLVQGTDRIDAEVMNGAPALKVVSTCSVGYDRIDLGAARDRGVVVCNAPATELIETTAEAAVALALDVAKRVTQLHMRQRDDDLPPYSIMHPTGVPVRNRTSGIVGAGRIGSAIARIMHRGFGNRILYFGRSAKPELESSLHAERRALDGLLAESDFVFVALPLTDDTRKLLGASDLAQLRQDAIVVNVGRAGIIDDAALIAMLEDGRLFGAGLDVYDDVARGCRHPNLVLTAHMANGENVALRATLALAVSNVIAVLTGASPPTTVA